MTKKGFGKPAKISLRDEVKFLTAFERYFSNSRDDKKRVFQFFQSNLEKLDESLLEALPFVFTKLTAHQSPERRQNVAALFGNFGRSIHEFPLGNRALNLEQSIVSYQLAQKIYTCEAYPKDWAITQNNLGNAYSKRIRGDRAENLELSIAAYERSLQVTTREAYPEDWAAIQNNLGIAYGERIRGDRAENLELSIASYEHALQVRTREAYPEGWAGTQNNLGIAYGVRIRGDRAENLELSIASYERALQMRTREAYPEDWAATQSNLGAAYRDRVRGDQLANLEKSIAIYNLAAQVFTQSAFPHKCSGNQGYLAEALTKHALLTDNFADLDAVISILQSALKIAYPGSPDFIDSQYRLGTALSHRYERSQDPNDLQHAAQAYKTALDLISPEHYDQKLIWQALPTTQAILGGRLVKEGKWQEGLQLLLNSVTQLSTGDNPLAHANALFQTGRAYETLSDWENARTYYRDALRLYKHLEELPGVARSQAGLGGVLVSQGYLEKGIVELKSASDLYNQLQKPEEAAELENLCQAAQKALERCAAEVYA